MKEAVLFDLDGTLVDSIPDIAACMNRVLRRCGLPAHPLDAYRRLTGNGALELARRATGDRQDLAEEVLSLFLREYALHSTELTAPYPGVPELLDALSAGGCRLCVLSNKEDGDVQVVVRHCFPALGFAAVRGRRPGVPLKPDPSAALAVASALGIGPQAFWYVGDTVTDMLCARHAGMESVAVTWGYGSRDELRETEPDHLLDTPEQIFRLLCPAGSLHGRTADSPS